MAAALSGTQRGREWLRSRALSRAGHPARAVWLLAKWLWQVSLAASPWPFLAYQGPGFSLPPLLAAPCSIGTALRSFGAAVCVLYASPPCCATASSCFLSFASCPLHGGLPPVPQSVAGDKACSFGAFVSCAAGHRLPSTKWEDELLFSYLSRPSAEALALVAAPPVWSAVQLSLL